MKEHIIVTMIKISIIFSGIRYLSHQVQISDLNVLLLIKNGIYVSNVTMEIIVPIYNFLSDTSLIIIAIGQLANDANVTIDKIFVMSGAPLDASGHGSISDMIRIQAIKQIAVR